MTVAEKLYDEIGNRPKRSVFALALLLREHRLSPGDSSMVESGDGSCLQVSDDDINEVRLTIEIVPSALTNLWDMGYGEGDFCPDCENLWQDCPCIINNKEAA